MKKIIFLTGLLVLLIGFAFAQTPARTVYQQIELAAEHTGNITDYVTAPAGTHTADYYLEVSVEGVTRTSDDYLPQYIRVCQTGPYATVVFDQTIWPAVWLEGSTIDVSLTYIPTEETATHQITVPDGSASVQLFGPSAWIGVPPFPAGPTEYTLEVNSNYAGAAIYLDGADTGQVTPYTFDPATAGTYSLQMTDVDWDPAEYVYAADASETVTFMGVIHPATPVITFPTADQVFEWEAAGEVTVEWEAGAGTAPEGYEAKMGTDAEWTDLGLAYEWTTPELGTGNYTASVRGYVEDPAAPGAKSYVPVKVKATDRGAVPSVKGNSDQADVNFEVIVTAPSFELAITSDPAGASIYLDEEDTGEVTPYTANAAGVYSVVLDGYTFEPATYEWDGLADDAVNFVGTEIPVDIPEGVDTPIGEGSDSVNITGGDANIVDDGEIPAFPNGSMAVVGEYVLELLGAGPWTVTFTTTAPWGAYYANGAWTAVEAVGGVITFVINPGKDLEVPIVLGDEDPTLPVELSVFNAVLTAQKFVKLTWISESETNMLGYYVYRNETQDPNSATLITPVMIPATNTSSTQVYNLEDREVAIGNTYYYWLEAADYGHSTMFGPQFVEVTGDVTPELPVQTVLNNAYPNPFKANTNTNIDVEVKAGDSGTVTIYNVLGQVVKTFKVNEGISNLQWNGRDSKGNSCGSGIYFYKLSTDSKNQTKKMVIVK